MLTQSALCDPVMDYIVNAIAKNGSFVLYDNGRPQC